MLGAGAAFSTVLTAYRYSNGMRGHAYNENDDEVERREALKKIRRRPLSETLEQLGEGRGTHTTSMLADPANLSRYLWPRLGGAKATEAAGELWSRREGGTGIDNTHYAFLEFKTETDMRSIDLGLYRLVYIPVDFANCTT
jgi:hypothetical protein